MTDLQQPATHSSFPALNDAYGPDYFQRLYHTASGQTLIDRLRDRIVHSLASRYSSGGNLLDVGCGYGYLLERFDQRWNLFGIDVSRHAAAVAQRRVPRAITCAADGQAELPFAVRFDVILATNVIEHLPQPEATARNLVSALQPGGVIVVHLPTINNAFNRWIYRYTYENDPTHIFRPSGARVNQLFEAAGMQTVHSLYCPFWPKALWSALKPHPAYLAVYVKHST